MTLLSPIKKNRVTVTGNLGAARTLVFVHGFGTDQSAWSKVAASFLADFRIVLLDNVGAVASDTAVFVQHHYLSLDAYATDLLDVCRVVNVQDAILVGHSAGAMIGVLAALRDPDSFTRLVLISASPRYLDEPGYHGGFTASDLDQLYSSMAGNYPEWAVQFACQVMGNPDQPDLASHFAATLKSIPAENALTILCSIFQSDHRAEVGRISQPTLIIQTLHDMAVPMEVAQYLHHRIARSELAVIDATGHLPHVSAPQQVVAAMRAFIDGNRSE